MPCWASPCSSPPSRRLPAQPAPAAGAKIVVASKIDTEGALLGSMIIAVLRAHDLPIENKLQLGPTPIVRGAILAGQIDIYPEYTGNGAFFFHRENDPSGRTGPRALPRSRGLDRDRNRLIWLAAAPANNTWAIAGAAMLARRERLATMADFARWVDGGGQVSSPLRPSSSKARRPCRPSRRPTVFG